jgi:hypothetical protein
MNGKEHHPPLGWDDGANNAACANDSLLYPLLGRSLHPLGWNDGAKDAACDSLLYPLLTQQATAFTPCIVGIVDWEMGESLEVTCSIHMPLRVRSPYRAFAPALTPSSTLARTMVVRSFQPDP